MSMKESGLKIRDEYNNIRIYKKSGDLERPLKRKFDELNSQLDDLDDTLKRMKRDLDEIKVDFENLLVIDNTFMESLYYDLPFRLKVYKGKSYYVLENPTFCQVFWIKFIHDRLAPAFQRQNIILDGEGDNMDLTLQVWINAVTLELYKPPSFIKSVAYFNSMIDSPEDISFTKYKSNTIRNIGIFALSVVGLVGLILPPIM